jgi:hypothetical protein
MCRQFDPPGRRPGLDLVALRARHIREPSEGAATVKWRPLPFARRAPDLAVRERLHTGDPPVADDPNAILAALAESLIETTHAHEHKLFAGRLSQTWVTSGIS